MAALPGAHVRDLLLQLKRSEWMPPYDDETVRLALAEARQQHQEITLTMSAADEGAMQDATITSGLVVHHKCLLRNKRGLLAYSQARLDRVKDLRWQTGSVVPAHLKGRLSHHELEFFAAYDRLLGAYMQEVSPAGFALDLTTDLQPPKDLLVSVRVLEDCGEIFTESGPVNLERHTTHYLRRSDVEHLIRMGSLEEVA